MRVCPAGCLSTCILSTCESGHMAFYKRRILSTIDSVNCGFCLRVVLSNWDYVHLGVCLLGSFVLASLAT